MWAVPQPAFTSLRHLQQLPDSQFQLDMSLLKLLGTLARKLDTCASCSSYQPIWALGTAAGLRAAHGEAAADSKPQQHRRAATNDASTSQPSKSVDHQPASYNDMILFRRCRYDVAFHEILYRELMLKARPKTWTSVPKLKSITLTIHAAQDTRLEKSPVPREDLLLYQLALETISTQPASFIKSQSFAGRADGVTVVLHGEPMLDFLEKLVYVILPNQIGFEGATAFKEVAPAKPPRPGKTPLVQSKMPKTYYSELKVTNLMLYPDFEANFDLFEPLRSMQVRFEVEDAASPEIAGLLLSGFSLPVKQDVAAAHEE